ncbi:SRPBCC family protein [Brumimicrobium mesophilum]|uniref:SRPBCC family protein n=1 Tax=Brumimicrobium mesophilum TaxID=392717 RepID=UPI000D14416C|nr:SRPBCC family protein [Brumimicrobium mesophilum]
MPIIQLNTKINAPIDRVFDLSRSIDLHKLSTAHTNEEAIAGRINGLIELHECVVWRAKHFGITQKLTSKITEFNAPFKFTDEMQKGAFKSFKHEHFFKEISGITEMTDIFNFTSPFGILGRMADKLFLKNYMTKLLEQRNKMIMEFSESDKWKEILT